MTARIRLTPPWLLLALVALSAAPPAAAFVGDAPPSAAAPAGDAPHPAAVRGAGVDRSARVEAASRPYRPGQVIVRYRRNVREERRADLRAHRGLRRVKDHRLTRSELAEIVDGSSVEDAVARLRADPRVLSAQPNYRYEAADLPNDALFGQLWGLDNVGQFIGGTRTNDVGILDVDVDAPEAWTMTMGGPEVVVGVIDTAVDVTHPDLAPNVWTNPGEVAGDGVDNDGNGFVDDVYGWNFFARTAGTWTPGEHFHGTHVAGTIAAAAGNAVGVAGVAPRVRIMQLQFLGPTGSGYTSDAVDALAYASAMGVRVTSNSWGGGGFDQELHDAICSYDGIFVAAAGNSGANSDSAPMYPAAYDCPNIVSVAAVTNRGALASFSNFGARSVDVAAPGVDVLSTMPAGEYGFLSGTSMATPHVSGVVALMLGMRPGLSGADARDVLVRTSKPLEALSGRTVSGGIVSAANALRALELITDPRDRAIEVPADQIVTATFFADVQPGPAYGAISLRRGDAPVPAATTLAGRVLRIVPAEPLAMDATYTVAIPSDAVRELTGRALHAHAWSFRTRDTIPPAARVTDPQDGATNVAGTKTITIAFDEEVKAGPALGSVSLESGGLAALRSTTVTGNVLAIDPEYSLAGNGTYVVTLPAGAVTDLAGNPQAALRFGFTAAVDVTGPAVVGYVPRPYQAEVPTTAAVVLDYTEPVTLAAAATGMFVNCNGIPAALSTTTSANVLTLRPVRPMVSNALCLAWIPEGAVQDLVGNTSAASHGVYFWTRDDQPPMRRGTTPADGATGVPAVSTITVEFDEDVLPGPAIGAVALVDDAGVAVPLSWSYLDDGHGSPYPFTLAFTPQDVLGSLRRYTFSVPAGAVTDVSAQRNGAPGFQLSFTTEQDVVAPRVSTSVPAPNAREVPVGAPVLVRFSEPVVPGSAWTSIVLRRGAAAVPASLAVSGDAVRVEPAAPLAIDASYTLTVPAAAVTDRAGNALATPYVFTFSTPDTLPPRVVASRPAPGAANVPVADPLWITFDEAATPGPAFAAVSLRDQAGGVVPVASAFFEDEEGAIPTLLVITPATPLTPDSAYTLTLPAGAVADAQGNASAAYALSFTTPYAVVAWEPAAGATGVPLDAAITLSLAAPGAQGPAFGAIALARGTTRVAVAATLSGAVLTVRPSAGLAANASYTLTVPAGAVVSGNGIALAPFTLTFRTFDPDVPRVTATSPASGATGVPAGAAIEVRWSEGTVPGPAFGAIAVRGAAGAAVPATVDYWCDDEGCLDFLLVVSPSAPLASGETYSVSLPAGALLDASGSASLPYGFGFTTR